MIRTYRIERDACRVDESEPGLRTAAEAAWIDLFDPTLEEEHAVEAAIGAQIPTRAEATEIEVSSRLYTERNAAVMTVSLLNRSGGPYPETAHMTFVLTARHLVTIRYTDPVSLTAFAETARRTPEVCASPESMLAGLIDAIVDRIADVLEETAMDLDALARANFTAPTGPRDLPERLQQLGSSGEVVAKAQDSLIGLSRLIAFAQGLPQVRSDRDSMDKLGTVARDADVLLEHAASLAARITFLLEALLGMINIEQNAIIKTFSVVAVMFLPPTLIASIYGMNFEHMPELDWRLGYPLAIGAMVASMIAPYLFFKRKGWI